MLLHWTYPTIIVHRRSPVHDYASAILRMMGKRHPLRRIIVHNRIFHWRATWGNGEGAGGERILHLRVWGGDKMSCPLDADLFNLSRLQRSIDLPWAAWTDDSYIMPKDVRAVIEYGLAHGWDPAGRGAPFRLTSADALVLDELALTDPKHNRAFALQRIQARDS